MRKNYKPIHHRERTTDRERMHIVIARVTVNACTTVKRLHHRETPASP